MQLVNQDGAQILPKSGYASTEANVAAARCSARLLQSGVNAFGDKAKLRTPRHLKRRPRVMRQHEDGRVIRRLVAPPALPSAVRPRASDRTEHVAPKNPGTDSGKALLRNFVIDPRLSIVIAVHPPPYACVEEPLHQLRAPHAERILEILVRPSTVAVYGNREALDAEFRHYIPRCLVRGTAQRWAPPRPFTRRPPAGVAANRPYGPTPGDDATATDVRCEHRDAM